MAILLLNHDTDGKIQHVATKLAEIEFLLDNAPKQMEAYANALTILKSLKRGLPRKDVLETWCSECCPPGQESHEECKLSSCPACWLEYIESIPADELPKDT